MPFDEWNHTENRETPAPPANIGTEFEDYTEGYTNEEEEERNTEEERRNAMPFSEERYTFTDLTGKNRPGNSTFSFVSLASGALSVLFGFCRVEALGLLLAVAAVLFALLSRKRQGYFDGKSIAGLFLGIFGAVVAIAFWILEAVQTTGPVPDNKNKTGEGISAWRHF